MTTADQPEINKVDARSDGPPLASTAPSGLAPAAPNLLEQVRTGDRSDASGEKRPARCSGSHAVKSVGAEQPLHGMTLQAIVVALSEHFGWEELGQRIPIRCFQSEPSVASSLKFLRKTPWARDKVEGLYLFMLRNIRRSGPTIHNFPPPANQTPRE